MIANADGAWAQARIGRVLSGRYRLDGLLGVGGMGAVFAATHVAVGRAVAVKMLRPDLAEEHTHVARFHGEARAAAAVGRRGVVEVLDFDVDPELGPFLVMERLQGEPLFARLERQGPLPVPQAVAVVAPLLRTLAIVHQRGIVHRDLKPQNIFLARDEDGTELPRILDFGISRMESSTRMTRTGALVGTPGFMAPEQARGARDIDARADLYAAGAILYQCLTGRAPHEAESPAHAVAMLLTGPPVSVASLRPELPPALVRVVETAMAAEPDARYESALAMHGALLAAVAAVPRTRELPIAPPPAGSRARTPRLLLVGAAALIALLTAAVVALAAIATTGGGAGPSIDAGPSETPDAAVRSALLARLEQADAARGDGRREEAMRMYAEIVWTHVEPRTDDARAVALAAIALAELELPALRPPETPAANQEEHTARHREVHELHGRIMRLYGRALEMRIPDLEPCALTGEGLVMERLADFYERMPLPLDVAAAHRQSAEGFEAASRTVARRHLDTAAELHRMAASQSVPGAEACAAEAGTALERIAARLAAMPP